MALSKIQSESVNLADDFAFSGTVTAAIQEQQTAIEALTARVTALEAE